MNLTYHLCTPLVRFLPALGLRLLPAPLRRHLNAGCLKIVKYKFSICSLVLCTFAGYGRLHFLYLDAIFSGFLMTSLSGLLIKVLENHSHMANVIRLNWENNLHETKILFSHRGFLTSQHRSSGFCQHSCTL